MASEMGYRDEDCSLEDDYVINCLHCSGCDRDYLLHQNTGELELVVNEAEE